MKFYDYICKRNEVFNYEQKNIGKYRWEGIAS